MTTAKVTESAVANIVKDALFTHTAFPTDQDTYSGEDRIVPRDLRQWLARLRLLEGVPFSYFVPDAELLPPESIRYFYLDRNWTDALVQGALSAGTFNSSDRAELQQLYRHIRGELDIEERRVRLPGGERVQEGVGGTITGFLLRSRAVSGWPAIHVRAYARDVVGDEEIVPESHPDRVKLLRLERLAPAVMLALFDGIPQLVHLEEPRQGIQFGVQLKAIGTTGRYRAEVIARDRDTSADVTPEKKIEVFFRSGAPGVVDLKRTGKAFVDEVETHMAPTLDGAEFALQMIRFPYRQVFGRLGIAAPISDVFRPTEGYTLSDFKVTFEEAVL